MKFFLITTSVLTNPEVVDLLLAAADKRGLETVRINADATSLAEVMAMRSSSKDIVYREASGEKARAVEAAFTFRNAPERPCGIRHTRSDGVDLQFPLSSAMRQMLAGVQTIPTVLLDETYAAYQEAELTEVVQSIGGFPVILKQGGLSHGQGVRLMKDAGQLLEALRSVKGSDLQKMMLRQYLASYRHARLVVLDGEIVDSIEYLVPEDDFRTNAGKITVVPQVFDDSVQALALSAARLSSVAFGGADVLIDNASGKAYLAEFNTPCNFARNQLTTGVPIAEMLIDYLTAETKK